MASYGTTNQSTQQSNHSHHDPSEEDALLPRKNQPQSPITRLQVHLSTNVIKDRADLVLLLCYLVTGLLDSSATAIWGAFVSMQTGNTVYLGLGLSNPSASTRWVKSLTSIAFFCLGSLFFSNFHRYFSPKRRWVLMASFTIQLLLIAGAAMVVMLTPKAEPGDEHDVHWHVLVPLAMVAFQSSGQAVTSRALQFNSMTSVVLTSIYCDLFADPKLLVGITQNAERNRRAASPVLLLLGAILGGFFSKEGQWGIAGALWTAVVLKAFIVLTWLFWKDDEAAEERNEN